MTAAKQWHRGPMFWRSGRLLESLVMQAFPCPKNCLLFYLGRLQYGKVLCKRSWPVIQAACQVIQLIHTVKLRWT